MLQGGGNRVRPSLSNMTEMLRSPAAILEKVPLDRGCQLATGERARIIEKCAFQYGKDNEELLETSPPNMFSVIGGQFLATGAKQTATRTDLRWFVT